MPDAIDEFPIRPMVTRCVRFGIVATGVGVVWSIGRAWMESVGIGFDVPWQIYVVATAVEAWLFVRFLRASRRLDRPAVRVSDTELVWGWVFRGERRRLPIDELRSVRSEGTSALVLETRSRRSVTMNTYEVVPEDRAELRRAIERRIESPAAAAQ